MRERGVLLSVDRAALHEPGPRSAGGTSGERVEGPIQRHLRRTWDWISGLR